MKLKNTVPQNSTMGAVKRTFFDKSGVWFWVAIGAIILCVSFWWNRRTERILPSNQRIDSAYAAPQPGSYMSGVSLPLFIPVQVPEKATQIIVTFKYRTTPSFQSAWLVIPTERTGGWSKILVDHELMRRHPLQSVFANGLSLYQKNVSYKTTNDFLRSSHDQQTVVADAYLMSWYASQSGQLLPFIPLETYTSTSSVPDYIWTTFVKPRIFPDGWVEFNRGMSITKPVRDNDGITTLQLVSDNPNEVLDITKPVIRFK